MATILNPDYLSKTVLLSSHNLTRAPRLPEEVFVKEEQATSGLKCVLVLEATNGLPIIRSFGSQNTLASLRTARLSFLPPPPAADGSSGTIMQENSAKTERDDSALD